MFFRKASLALLAVVAAVSAAAARDLVVDKAAPAGGDGSPSHPYQRIQSALNVAMPGDRVLVQSGLSAYREALHFPRSGRSGNPIILEGAGNGATVRGVGLKGTPTLLIRDQRYIEIRKMNFYRTNSPEGSIVRIEGRCSFIEMDKIGLVATRAYNWDKAVSIVGSTQIRRFKLTNFEIDVFGKIGKFARSKIQSAVLVSINGNVRDFSISQFRCHQRYHGSFFEILGGRGVCPDPQFDFPFRGTIADIRCRREGQGFYLDGTTGVLIDGAQEVFLSRFDMGGFGNGICLESTKDAETSGIVIRDCDWIDIQDSGLIVNGGRSGVRDCDIQENRFNRSSGAPSKVGMIDFRKATSIRFLDNAVEAIKAKLPFISIDADSVDVKSDFNHFRTRSSVDDVFFTWHGQIFSPLSAFQKASGQDKHSSVTNSNHFDYIDQLRP